MMPALRRELGPMVRLAAPLAVAELGWMAMGFVDTIMAGRIDAASLGAGGLGNMLYFPIVISATGLLAGMDTLVSQAFGAGDDEDCRRTLICGLWLSLLLAPVVTVVFALMAPLIGLTGPNPSVMAALGPYVRAMAWGVPPLLFYNVFRRYLQARNVVRPITFAVVSANVINFAGNWLLMYGNWGASRMELEGSGISTSLARLYMGLVLGVVVWRYEQRARGRIFQMNWRPEWPRMLRLTGLGAPVTAQIGVEGAVFAVVSVLAAKLDPVSLGAHVVAVNVISITFMVPLGISAAAAVRVGQAVGRRDPKGVAAAGWTALALAAMFMACAGVALFTIPHAIARLYTPDPAVVASGAALLVIAAWFQLFDGQQIVATGALRGLGDTRTPAIAHFVGYWIFGMPVAYALCFRYGWGVRGIWIGLTVALVLVGVALLLVWRKNSSNKAITLPSESLS